jgi:aerobic carbon-monoxide dehydrogenase small subunit
MRRDKRKELSMSLSEMPGQSVDVSISFTINRAAVTLDVKPSDTALSVLRDRLGLKGTKEGCGIGECGACTIVVDGKAVDACLMFAPQLDGRHVLTVEGLSDGETLHPLQQEFVAHGAVQCGYCTPGMLASAKALLDENPSPDRGRIVEALSGNLCRCTGYVQVVEAVEAAALRCGREQEKL